VLALTAGGTGNNWGAVLGACLVVFFLESTRFATAWLPGLQPVQVAAVREFVIGASLILGGTLVVAQVTAELARRAQAAARTPTARTP
jgi:ABC-type branched-subunit amino acid transport system permease subunit